MKAEEIFKVSVMGMKQVLSSPRITASIRRASSRSEEENRGLLLREREQINQLVRQIARAGGRPDLSGDVREELIDAVVIRYLRNREIFMKTFPQGIEEIDPDPVSVWAAIMISPRDEISGDLGNDLNSPS